MKKHGRFIYIFIVILPSILAIIGFYDFLSNRAGEEHNQELEWIASLHKNQMDQFISETKVSLDILAVSIEEEMDNVNKVKSIFKKMANQDPRYGGIYLLDFEGNLLVGTNDYLKQYNLRNKQYIKEVLLTKDTAVSDEVETLSNNQAVIAVATPVLKNEQVEAIIVSHIRLDYMKNIMKVLTPEHSIFFENAKQIPVFSVNETSKSSENELSFKYPLSQLPWNLVISTDEQKNNSFIGYTFLFAVVFIVLLHIVYLFIKYMMLKRQTGIERMQQESQKLELIGTLAASTAHEIRNPLTGIKGLVQLLNEKYNDQEDEFYFSIINKEIARINQIVSELLILGKPTAQKVSIVDIRDIVSDLNPLIYSEANLYSVDYKVTLPDQETWVKVNVDQLKQVILNLTKNAFEAMNNGGELRLTILKKEDHCQLLITDDGPGIEKEKQDQLFKPFFTSKENGTGLGLVVCKRIVDSFDGTIEIESEFGFGTTVSIALPLQTRPTE
ncbi:PAS domain-containing sensor histidine kinase [Bacillus sp. REN10]|uniref:PAS domain-containing sensor histidine kinase n=1 Tax=Bacillus sp. REN10 TaxID=2782541 RepID=UPI00193B95FF|nr:PAS domain-containing sensor histidine kinase [Bacillus sp. REN10]